MIHCEDNVRASNYPLCKNGATFPGARHCLEWKRMLPEERSILMKHKGIRFALAVIEVFIGVGAIYGGTAILTGAFDQWLAGDWLRGTPFTGYTIPGLTLAIV